MAKVTRKIKRAETDIKRGNDSSAQKKLKSAENQNKRLTKIDKTVRDPIIHGVENLCKKVKK